MASLCLIDFGLAKANELDFELTGTREIFGTPYYMSPEQGHAEIIDARSDLYSLGVVFYEMLIGRKPYTGATGHGSHLQAQARRIAAPSSRNSRSTNRCLRRLLAKSPEDRLPIGARGPASAVAALQHSGMSQAPRAALLRAPTPAAWIERPARSPDVLLIDHANCEKKAASTALALMFAYAEDLELADKMSRLAREELRHYEQVAKLMRGLQIAPQRLAPGRYAARLRRLVARSEPQREVDLMICGAFIEARSCERFAALGPVLGGPLGDLFDGLHAAEARHFKLYLELWRGSARAASRTSMWLRESRPLRARGGV